ncbi:hypothetical protein G2W53_042894 [Senna tora]|uniref:Uncharacterized protein n=1 Tax=Senna tora TaxID=362788 RepID=A0A834SGR3_9FABA|nr:hypothetical protein G2W53_042894 [Senna tora]
MGTPYNTPSLTELHPPCVTNTPTEPCPKTRVWGAQVTILPLVLELVLSTNPFGKKAFRSSLRAHRNGTLLCSSASAMAANSRGDGATTVPRLM